MNITKKLIIIFIIFVLVKTILSVLIPAPIEFSDGYTYSKMARSFFYERDFFINQVPTHAHPPLYPMLLSISFLANNMVWVYILMKFINALLSSLILFPSFFLAKEFLTTKKALFCSILISVIPSNFAFSPFIMAENLFYPLFIFSIYFLYKSFKEKTIKYDILTGIFAGLAYLTRPVAIILFLTIIISTLIIIFYKKDFIQIKKKLILALFTLLIITPWLIRNYIHFGITGLLEFIDYSPQLSNIQTIFSIPQFLSWIVLYLGFLILSSGIIFFILSLTAIKQQKTFSIIAFTSVILAILLASFHNMNLLMYQNLFSLTGRPIGRYIDFVLPLIFILGFKGLELYKTKSLLKFSIIPSLILLFSSQLLFFPLFPVNNVLLVHLGILKMIIERFTSNLIIPFILLILLFALFSLFIFKKLNTRKFISISIIFFLLISLVSFAATYYISNSFWYNKDQTQLGIWFNYYDKPVSNVLFDERDCGVINKDSQDAICTLDKQNTVIGFWLNDNILIGNASKTENIDYIISRQELPFNIIKKTDNGIFIYDTKPI